MSNYITATSVLSKKIYTEQMSVLVRMLLQQPCMDSRHTTSEAFQALQGLCNAYTVRY